MVNEGSYQFRDNFDGVYDTLTKKYIIDANSLYGEIISDTSIQIVGADVTLNYSNNTYSFNTKDSLVVIQCDGYYDLEIQIPNYYEDWQLILIRVVLEPILSEFESNTIKLRYNKKTGVAKLNDHCYKVEIEK